MNTLLVSAALLAAAPAYARPMATEIAVKSVPPSIHRYWPVFPAPKVVYRLRTQPQGNERFLLHSLAGLAARRARLGGPAEYVWIPNDGPAYRSWYAQIERRFHPKVVTPNDVWDLLAKFRKDGLVKGYIRFRPDDSDRGAYSRAKEPSANAATMACGPLSSVLLADDLLAKASDLPQTLDARDMTEGQAFDRFKSKLSRKLVGLIDPKVPELRSDAIAMDAPIAGVEKTTFEAMLVNAERDVPVLGWCVGDEWEFTSISSRHGAFQTATNWCSNLPLLSTMPLEVPKPAARRTYWDLPWQNGVHYTAFVMSDGDNVQWETGSFLYDSSRKWWNASTRGSFPMGWTACQADLSQLVPAALSALSRTATPNDDLVLMSGGYYYPDLFPRDAMRLHASRIAAYVARSGITAVSCLTQKWDSPQAVDAYASLLSAMPGVEGLLPLQYAPYNAGLGKVLWIGDRPVASARCMMWADLKLPMTGDPKQVAAMLNEQPVVSGTPTDANFSWVTVHAWSDFRTGVGNEKLGGFPAVERCVANLAPQVKVVTPTDFLRLMRLRLRPKTTLDGLIKGLEAARPNDKTVQNARQAWQKGDYASAFRLGKLASRR